MMYSSAINQLLCAVYVLNEVFVFQSLLHYQIDFSAKNRFQGFLKVEVVCNIIPLLMVCSVKTDKQIHIALVIESIRKDRTKDGQSLDLVLPAKFKYPLKIKLDQFHDVFCVTDAKIAVFLIYKRFHSKNVDFAEATDCGRGLCRRFYLGGG